MNIVKANAKLMEHNNHPYAFIEKVGRTCYKSEDKITDESAVAFVKSLVKKRHGAMLEHEIIYLRDSRFGVNSSVSERTPNFIQLFWQMLSVADTIYDVKVGDHKSLRNYVKVDYFHGIAGASFRTWIQIIEEFKDRYPSLIIIISRALHGEYPEIFEELAPTTIDPESPLVVMPRSEVEEIVRESEEPSDLLFHTVLFTCDRGVSHEFVRHRPASFGQESTRYCNYTRGQFGSEITVIEPCFWSDHDSVQYRTWKNACELAESNYFELINSGATAQEARSVLPNSLKTEIFITASEVEWQHIVNLRYHGTTGAPHPQMKEVMTIAYPLLVEASNGRIK